MKSLNTRDKAGRYEAGLDRMCTCGHTNGTHIVGGHECTEFGCPCDKFKRDRKNEK